jgi:hypothetical protein
VTAPAFRQKVQYLCSGSPPFTVPFPAASLTGSLLTMALFTANTVTPTTPSGWSVGLATTGLTSPTSTNKMMTVFYKTSAGETSVNVTTDNGSQIVMAEHTGLHSPAPYAAAVIRRDGNGGPGYGKMPAVSYGAGPMAVLGWMFMSGGPQFGDDLAASGTGVTLRTPIHGPASVQNVALADVLLDTTAGATVLYPGAGAWIFTFTDTGYLAGVGIAFGSGTAPTTPGVFIDWDGDGFDIGDNDNVTTYAERWHIQRGSGPEIIGGAQPGSAVLTFKNTSDRFNPFNASGPMYGKLKDGLAMWIGVADDGTVAGSTANGLFGGRVTDITLIPGEGTSVAPEVEFVCEDAIGWYRRLPCKLDYAEGRSHSALRAAALAAAGETRTTLAAEIHTMPLSHADTDLLSVLDGINSINGTRHFCAPADLYTDWYSYTSRNRQYGLTGTGTALSASAQHADGTDGWRLSADTVINHQEAVVTPVLFTPATFTVWQEPVLPFTITVARPYTVIASFDDVVFGSALNIASTGASVVSTYTPFGSAGKITLTVASGTATVNNLSIIGRLARRLENERATVDDTTSQSGTRGVRAGSEIGGEYLGTLESAQGIAAHVVWRYGNPQLRPTLTVENWFPTMFSLDLYDNIAFTSTQLGMSARIFEIVGITHDGHIAATNVQYHTVTYVLQESRTQTDPGWFILDSSLLDGPKLLAY